MEQMITVKGHSFHGLNRINRFRKENRYCDFIIKVGSQEIPVHRNVICSHSDYFDKMFSHDTREKITGVVELKDVDYVCTVKCVDFMYTGQTCVLEDKCGDQMHVATMFLLPKMCNAIADFLAGKLDCNSFLATKDLADLYSCQKLVNACNHYALKHFQEFAQSEEFKQLDFEYIGFLVGSKNAKASEGVKCKSVIEWIKYDSPSRKTFLLGLLEKLDLTELPLSYRSFLLEHEPLVYSFAEASRIIGISFAKTMNVSSKDVSLAAAGDFKEIAVFDIQNESLQAFNMAGRMWTPIKALNNHMLQQHDFSAVVLEQHLYVLMDDLAVYRIAYSIPDSTWEQMPNKKLPCGPAVALNGCIFTTAYSYEYGDISNQTERYDPIANKWYLLPDKEMIVEDAALAIVEGKLFCIGGFADRRFASDDVKIYDPTLSTWKYGYPLNKARFRASAATHEEGIYVMGGLDMNITLTSDVEYRCPASKVWTVLRPMTFPRESFSSCYIAGKIFVIGGDSSDTKTIEEYDPEAKEWKIIDRTEGMNIKSSASICLPM